MYHKTHIDQGTAQYRGFCYIEALDRKHPAGQYTKLLSTSRCYRGGGGWVVGVMSLFCCSSSLPGFLAARLSVFSSSVVSGTALHPSLQCPVPTGCPAAETPCRAAGYRGVGGVCQRPNLHRPACSWGLALCLSGTSGGLCSRSTPADLEGVWSEGPASSCQWQKLQNSTFSHPQQRGERVDSYWGMVVVGGPPEY